VHGAKIQRLRTDVLDTFLAVIYNSNDLVTWHLRRYIFQMPFDYLPVYDAAASAGRSGAGTAIVGV
jgi:hypothetical protein